MAIHTGFAVLLLSVGFLHIRKTKGFGRIFRAQTTGGLVARRLVPLAIFTPIAIGAVFNRFNFGQLRLGIAFVVIFNVLFIVAVGGSRTWNRAACFRDRHANGRPQPALLR